ncbi:hypothetical protein ABZ896_37805 [Streptomyces sp. NPDC047072]|uniref:hypothetical protein n=1 Tax=Streptomyces sp. NPDC047072 TaxID=3154809 RepID=UPI0033C6ACEC
MTERNPAGRLGSSGLLARRSSGVGEGKGVPYPTPAPSGALEPASVARVPAIPLPPGLFPLPTGFEPLTQPVPPMTDREVLFG